MAMKMVNAVVLALEAFNKNEVIQEILAEAAANGWNTNQISKLELFLNPAITLFIGFARIIQFLVLVLLCRFGLKLADFLLNKLEKLLSRKKVSVRVRSFTMSVMSFAIYGFVIIKGFEISGLSSSSLVAYLGTIGLTLSMAFKDVGSNIISGAAIMILKPFDIGQYIRINSLNTVGQVTSITVYYTELLTMENTKVQVPNGQLSNAEIVNYSESEHACLAMSVSFPITCKVEELEEFIQKIIDENPHVMHEKGTRVSVGDIQRMEIKMNITVWVPAPEANGVKASILREIKIQMEERDIKPLLMM